MNYFLWGDETNVINFNLDNSAEFNFTAAVQDFDTWDELKAEMKCSVYYKKKIWIKQLIDNLQEAPVCHIADDICVFQ